MKNADVTPLVPSQDVFQISLQQDGAREVEEVDANPPGKGEKPPPSPALADWKTWTYAEYFTDCKKVVVGAQP